MFTFALVVWLLLCLATAALWARSLRHADVLGYEGREPPGSWQRGGYVSSADGVVGCEWWLRQNPPLSRPLPITGWQHTEWPISSTTSLPNEGWWGFSYHAGQIINSRPSSDGRAAPRYIGFFHRVTVPHWALLLVLLTPVALWLQSELRRQRRRSLMQCRNCGYDLRASSVRCPECGMAVPQKVRATA